MKNKKRWFQCKAWSQVDKKRVLWDDVFWRLLGKKEKVKNLKNTPLCGKNIRLLVVEILLAGVFIKDGWEGVGINPVFGL
jgi:hypothetical protein